MDRVNIMRESWDYLIILDACRYDYFERCYLNFFQGELSKKISKGSCTSEWLDNSFPDYYDDVIYITANPQINSVSQVCGFLAGEHFHTVHEVWKDGWDKQKQTVLPETLTHAALEIFRKTRNKRYIIHYLQPHAPYLTLNARTKGLSRYLTTADPDDEFQADKNAGRRLIEDEQDENVSIIKKKFLKILLRLFEKNNILGNHPDWHLRKLLRMPTKKPMEGALRICGRKGLRKAYEANLLRVLEQVAVLLKQISGRIVITSDHGELLGENKLYSHPSDSLHPILLEVPWLVIDRPGIMQGQNDPATDNKADNKDEGELCKPIRSVDNQVEQQELAQKLRDLGYYD